MLSFRDFGILNFAKSALISFWVVFLPIIVRNYLLDTGDHGLPRDKLYQRGMLHINEHNCIK
jgi:hypothetical protein